MVKFVPRNVRMGLHDGTSHNLTFPVQLPVARIWLLGANLTWAIGRSSPIWEPNSAKFCEDIRTGNCQKGNRQAYLDLRKYFLAYVKNTLQRHFAVYSLLSDSFLSSTWGRDKGSSKHLADSTGYR